MPTHPQIMEGALYGLGTADVQKLALEKWYVTTMQKPLLRPYRISRSRKFPTSYSPSFLSPSDLYLFHTSFIAFSSQIWKQAELRPWKWVCFGLQKENTHTTRYCTNGCPCCACNISHDPLWSENQLKWERRQNGRSTGVESLMQPWSWHHLIEWADLLFLIWTLWG